MLLKSEEFWKVVEDEVTQENGEYIAIHTLYMLKTYKYLGGNIKGFPVSRSKFEGLLDCTSRIAQEYIKGVNFLIKDSLLKEVAMCFKNEGTKAGIRKAIDFLKNHPSGVNMIAISGVLNGVLETDLSIPDYVLVLTVDRELNNIIKGKEVDDIG